MSNIPPGFNSEGRYGTRELDTFLDYDLLISECCGQVIDDMIDGVGICCACEEYCVPSKKLIYE